MSFLENVNWIDAMFGLVVLLFTFRGLLRGMVKEIIGLVGILLGFSLATRYFSQVTGYFDGWIVSPQFKMYAAYAAIFIGINLIGMLISLVVKRCMSMAMLSWLDHLLGGVIGLAKGSLFCAIGFTLLQRISPDTPFLKDSLFIGYSDQIMAFASFFLPVMKQ